MQVDYCAGVLSPHRKQGLGSLLMNTLLAHVSTLPSCRAVYLHVQASNHSAQKFYNKYAHCEREMGGGGDSTH